MLVRFTQLYATHVFVDVHKELWNAEIFAKLAEKRVSNVPSPEYQKLARRIFFKPVLNYLISRGDVQLRNFWERHQRSNFT